MANVTIQQTKSNVYGYCCVLDQIEPKEDLLNIQYHSWSDMWNKQSLYRLLAPLKAPVGAAKCLVNEIVLLQVP